MKTVATIVSALLLAGIPAADAIASVAVSTACEAPAPKKKTENVTFSVSMDCEKCANKIRENISFEKGVKDLDVDAGTKQVKVTYDPRKTTVEKLQKAIERLGYTAKVIA